MGTTALRWTNVSPSSSPTVTAASRPHHRSGKAHRGAPPKPQNAQAQVNDAEPAYADLGARSKVLRLAEEEAKDLREEARRAAEQHRELAESAAQQVRNDAGVVRRRAQGQVRGRGPSGSSRRPRATPRSCVPRRRRTRESARGGGRPLRGDPRQGRAGRRRLETNLAKRREQSERDLASRQAEAEKRSRRSSTARSSFAWRRRSCARTPSAAPARPSRRRSAQAGDIVADANAKADRIRSESERSWRPSPTAATTSTRS